MDTKRAKEIINDSNNTIQVLYQGSPVWLESIKDNNTAVISFIENNNKEEVLIYKLVENESAK